MGDLMVLRHNTNTAERALAVVVVVLTLGEEKESLLREKKGDNATLSAALRETCRSTPLQDEKRKADITLLPERSFLWRHLGFVLEACHLPR